MERYLAEKLLPKTIIQPVNLNTAGNTGLRVDMANCKRVTFLVILAGGTTTTSLGISLHQHTVATSGTPIALAIDSPYYYKVGAATSFTKVAPVSAADTYDMHAIVGDNVAILVFEVLAEQLTQGYRYVSLDIAQPGVTEIGAVLALADVEYAPAYAQIK